MVQIMAWRRPGDKPLSEPMVVSLPTHICVARPQWVKFCFYFWFTLYYCLSGLYLELIYSSGVSYSKYPRFHAWRDERMEVTMDWDFIRNFNGTTPGLTEKLGEHLYFLHIRAYCAFLSVSLHWISLLVIFIIIFNPYPIASRTANMFRRTCVVVKQVQSNPIQSREKKLEWAIISTCL